MTWGIRLAAVAALLGVLCGCTKEPWQEGVAWIDRPAHVPHYDFLDDARFYPSEVFGVPSGSETKGALALLRGDVETAAARVEEDLRKIDPNVERREYDNGLPTYRVSYQWWHEPTGAITCMVSSGQVDAETGMSDLTTAENWSTAHFFVWGQGGVK